MSRKIPQRRAHPEFRLSESQSARLREWILEIETRVATKQVETGKDLAVSAESSEGNVVEN
jgi:hypothetical protein